MRSRLLLNLALLLALLALGLFAYFRPAEEAAEKIQVTELKREDVERIRVEHNQFDYQLERRDGSWFVTAPYQTLANQLLVDRLLDMTMATASGEFPAEKLARYGLEPVKSRVTLNDQAFEFGDINDITNEQYLASNGRVYLVRTFYGYGLPADGAQMISPRLLADHEKPVEYDFGAWQAVQDDKGAWTIRGAPPERGDVAPSADDLNIWVAEWKLASGMSVIPFEGEAGGDRVIVRFSNGESAAFHVIAREPDIQLVRADARMQYKFGTDAGSRLLDPYRVAQQ